MELLYSDLDVKAASEEELFEAIKRDYNVHSVMKRKTADLQKASANSKKETRPREVLFYDIGSNDTVTDVDLDFESEVDYYYSMVQNIDITNLEKDLVEALPSVEHYQYKKILIRIRAEILRNIKFIRALLSEPDVTAEDIESFSSDIELEYKKFNMIGALVNEPKIERLEKTVKQNNLILLPTLKDNVRIIEDLSNIDIEYYDRFLELLISIKDGTFKNVKRFISNDNLVGLCEVRDFKTRVLFKRLNSDTYVIIGAFVKKTDNDSFYRNMVVGYYDLYKKMDSYLRLNCDNPEFLETQNSCAQELFDMLQDKNVKVIKRGGK